MILKKKNMKRKLLYTAGFVLMMVSFQRCDVLNDCKVCRQNTYNANGDLVTEGSESEYCDTELIAIEATPSATVGGVTTKWVCR